MPFKVVPPLYSVWQSMLRRCRDQKHGQWKNYGGRGIIVCARWKHSFQNFIEDMGPRPTPEYTLERKNNDKNYTPDNCKWATRKEQQRNLTVTVWVEIEGKRYKAVELAEIAGVKTDTIVVRAKNGLSYASVVTKGRLRWDNGRHETHCKNGHEYTPENTRLYRNGARVCRKCARVNAQRAYWKSREDV
jgi:hypothetical protein